MSILYCRQVIWILSSYSNILHPSPLLSSSSSQSSSYSVSPLPSLFLVLSSIVLHPFITMKLTPSSSPPPSPPSSPPSLTKEERVPLSVLASHTAIPPPLLSQRSPLSYKSGKEITIIFLKKGFHKNGCCPTNGQGIILRGLCSHLPPYIHLLLLKSSRGYSQIFLEE